MYNIYIQCLCGDQVMVRDKKTKEHMGYDDENPDNESIIFLTLEEAIKECEFSDEYVQDEDGNVVYYGEVCNQCRNEETMGKATCEACKGTGKIARGNLSKKIMTVKDIDIYRIISSEETTYAAVKKDADQPFTGKYFSLIELFEAVGIKREDI